MQVIKIDHNHVFSSINVFIPITLQTGMEYSSSRNLMTSLSASNQRMSPFDSRHQREPSHTPRRFYGRTCARRSLEEETWQPGQYLPSHTEPPPEPDFYTLLVQMKSSISTQLQQVQTSVDTLSGRVDKLERLVQHS